MMMTMMAMAEKRCCSVIRRKKNPDKKHTISVSQKAAKKHLKKHPNDFLGDCSTAETCTLIVPCSCWDEDLLAIGNNPFYHLNEGAFCVSIIEEDGDINTTISFAGPEVTEARVVIKTEGNEVIGHLCASVHVSNGGTETAHDYSEFTAISEAEYLGCKAILENHSVCQQQPQCKPLRIPCADASECCDAAAICDPGCCLPDQQAGCLIDDDCCDSPCVNGTCVP